MNAALRQLTASHALALGMLATPAMALAVPLGLAPLFVATAIIALALGWRQRPLARLPRHLVLPLAAILAWAALSILWAPAETRGLRLLLALVGETVLGLALVGLALACDEAGRRRVEAGLVAGLWLGLALFFAGLVLGGTAAIALKGDLYAYSLEARRFNRGLTVMVLLAWPAFLALRRQGRATAAKATLAGIALAALVGVTAAAKLAVALILLMMLAWRRRPAPGRLVGWLAVAMVFLVPLAAVNLPDPHGTAEWRFIPYSSHHRLTIWGFTGQNIAQRPLLGWGLDASRAIPGGDDEVVVKFPAFELTEPQLPLHPHNAILQWWLELGLPGAALFALLLWRLARATAAPGVDPEAGTAALTLLVVILFIAAVSFGFWQSWWQACIWLVASQVAQMLKPPATSSAPPPPGR